MGFRASPLGVALVGAKGDDEDDDFEANPKLNFGWAGGAAVVEAWGCGFDEEKAGTSGFANWNWGAVPGLVGVASPPIREAREGPPDEGAVGGASSAGLDWKGGGAALTDDGPKENSGFGAGGLGAGATFAGGFPQLSSGFCTGG